MKQSTETTIYFGAFVILVSLLGFFLLGFLIGYDMAGGNFPPLLFCIILLFLGVVALYVEDFFVDSFYKFFKEKSERRLG